MYVMFSNTKDFSLLHCLHLCTHDMNSSLSTIITLLQFTFLFPSYPDIATSLQYLCLQVVYFNTCLMLSDHAFDANQTGFCNDCIDFMFTFCPEVVVNGVFMISLFLKLAPELPSHENFVFHWKSVTNYFIESTGKYICTWP